MLHNIMQHHFLYVSYVVIAESMGRVLSIQREMVMSVQLNFIANILNIFSA